MAENNSASTMMVALIAILVIIVVGFLALRLMPGAGDDNGTGIDVEVTGGADGGSMNPGQ